MSDNPELIGIDAQIGDGFDQLIKVVDQIIAAEKRLVEANENVTSSADGMANAFDLFRSSGESVNSFANAIQELEAQMASAADEAKQFAPLLQALQMPTNLPEQSYFDSLVDGWHNVAQAAEEAATSEQKAVSLQDYVNQMLERNGMSSYDINSYGEFGQGDIPLGASDTSGGDTGGGGDDSSSVDGTRIGSLYGIARALRASGGGGLATGLYEIQGLRQAVDLLPKLNAAIEETPSLLMPLIDGLTGLGVPMAGLLSVAGMLAPAIGLLIVGLNNFNAEVNAGKAALNEALDAQHQYAKDSAALTTDEAKKRIAANDTSGLKQARDYDVGLLMKAANVDDLPEARERLKKEISQALANGDWSGVLNEFDLKTRPAAETLIEGIKKLNTEIDKSDGYVNLLTNGIQQNAFAANDAAQAARDKAAHDEAMTAKFIADDKLTMQSAQDKAAQLAEENVQHVQSIATIKAQDVGLAENSTAHLANIEAIKQYQQKIDDNRAELEHITQVSEKLIQTRIDEREGIKLVEQVIKSARAEIETFGKGLENFAKNVNKLGSEVQAADDKQSEQASLARAKARDESTKVSVTDDIAAKSKIALDYQRKLADDIASNAVTLANIRQQEQNKEQADQLAYNRQVEDDQTRAYDTRAKIAREAQDTEERNQLEHQNKLAEINENAHQNDQNALLNRNFLALTQTSNSTKKQIDAENDRYAQQEQLEKQHVQAQIREETIAEAQVAQQRRTAYQRKIEDDENALHIELDRANQAEAKKEDDLVVWRNRQLQDLAIGERAKLQIIQNTLDTELKLYIHQRDQRIQLLESEAATTAIRTVGTVANQVQNSGLASIFSGALQSIGHSMRLFDSGGSFGAGEPFMKGNISESFDFGGSSYNIPGAAMVFPLQSGTATPNSGVNATFYITAHDPEGVRREVVSVLQKVMK